MSDKIYRTVTFEIEPSGDCIKCEAQHTQLGNVDYCRAFNENIKWYQSSGYRNCQACKDYLEAEKAKLRKKLQFNCRNCNDLHYFDYGFQGKIVCKCGCETWV